MSETEVGGSGSPDCYDAAERRREYHRKWRKENAAKHAEKQRKWRAKNKDAARAIWQRSVKNRTPEQKKLHMGFGHKYRDEKNLGWWQVPRRQQRWSDEEVKAIFNRDRTTAQIAEDIGRSYKAVLKARKRYCHCAPFGWSSVNESS